MQKAKKVLQIILDIMKVNLIYPMFIRDIVKKQ